MPPQLGSACLLVALILCGCTGQRTKLEAPEWETQRSAIETLVPLGTPRDDAAARLEEAGIAFSPSGTETEYRPGMQASTFYCAMWHRPDGSVWPLNVALWFDQQGLLYGVKQADAEIAPPRTAPTTGGPVAGAVTDPFATTKSPADATGESPNDAGTETASPRSGQFRPFNTP